ncbi:MAG: DNA alkylation repair protein [Nitrospirota bacterium]|nr:MAG: DNA alkylation repair protein [Nitrospirota bacterium]
MPPNNPFVPMRTRKRPIYFKDFLKILTRLSSPVLEDRLLALLILVRQYHCGAAANQEEIVKAYLANLEFVNNWDFVDSNVQHLLVAHLKKTQNIEQSYTAWCVQPDFGIGGSP